MVHGSREKTTNLDLLQIILKKRAGSNRWEWTHQTSFKKKPTLLKPKATMTEIQLAVLSRPCMKSDMSLNKQKDVLDWAGWRKVHKISLTYFKSLTKKHLSSHWGKKSHALSYSMLPDIEVGTSTAIFMKRCLYVFNITLNKYSASGKMVFS